MGAGRRLADEFERHRSRRRSDLDPESVEAAAQTLLDCWPWLTEQYRRGAVMELPTQPLAAAIRTYLQHAGIDPH